MMQVTVTNKGHSAVSTVRDSISIDEWLGDSEYPHSTTTVSLMTIESFRFEAEDDYEYDIFPILRDGPLEIRGEGGGRSTKKIFAQVKIKRKKKSCTPINPKKYSCYSLTKFIQGI